MPELRENLKTIFGRALEIRSDGERANYLDQACADDESLRAEVDDLLGAMKRAGNFLGGSSPADATLDQPSLERPGTQIGRYKLLQEIGEGGFGVVYMAEQREPVRRKVALKIIKPGMDTRAIVARFEAERQALALMDHPNIAHVFDAGATESGRPYFVMELVHGVALTEYCDQTQLTTAERLELFVQVCQAVQHAHQKGIIHRDLKPSNVMVTLYDGVPVPKVIDFGVAKATGGQLTEKTAFTGYGQMIGTPLYMSPEQTALSALDVDTRSDVYSLGVLLYELLTGTTPFTKEQLREAGIDEIRRMIREDEPLQPSARISTLGATATTVSTHRKTAPAKLGKLLRRDLDWIVMKALQKDRTRRYQTASDFARDIQRYLADEPIEAKPPTLVGRMAKWGRRHRPLLRSAAVALAAAIAVLVVSAFLLLDAYEGEKREHRAAVANASEAKNNAAKAQDNAAKAQKNYAIAREAVKQMLTRVANEQVAKIPEMKEIRRSLLEDAVAFYTELLKLTPRDPLAYFERGHVYELLAQYDKGRADYEKAIELDPDNPEFHYDLACLCVNCPDVAQRDATHGLEHAKRAVELQPKDAKYRGTLAIAYGALGAKKESVSELEKLVELAPDTDLANLAAAHLSWRNDQDYKRAVPFVQKAIDLSPSEPEPYLRLGELYVNLGEDEKALAAVNKGLEIHPTPMTPGAFAYYLTRGDIYARRKMYAAALADYDKSVELGPFRSYTYKRRGLVHFYLKDYEKALADIAKAVELKPDDTSNLRWIPIELAAKCPDAGFRQRLVGLIDKTIEKVGDQGGLYAWRAIFLATLDRRQEALAALAKLRELNPSLAWREGTFEEILVHSYGLLTPDDRRLGKAVDYLRERAQASDTVSPPLIRWASQWVPAAMRGTDNLPGIAFVSDLPWLRSTCGWGSPVAARNSNHWSGTILIDRLPYALGIYTNAFDDAQPADVVLDVTGQEFSTFKAQVGLPEANGSVQYQVLVDGNTRGETAVLRGGMLRSLEVDVAGAKEIVLRVLNGGDGNAYDSAAWGFARLLRADAVDPLEEPPAELRSASEAKAGLFLAEVHSRLDQKDLARRWYDKAVEWMDKNAPKDEQLLRFRAEADEEQAISALAGDPQAIMRLAKSAAKAPDQPDLRRRLALVVIRRVDGALRENRFNEAITMLQTLPKDFSGGADYRWGVVKCLSRNGQHDGAIASLEKLTADFPAAAEYRKELAGMYFNWGDKPFHEGDLEKAFPDLDRALQCDPNYSEAYDHRGFVYLSRGELDKAIADYDQAIRFGPAYPSSYWNRASAYLGKGEFDKANADLAKAIDSKPDDANLRYLLACARLATARVEEYRRDCGEMLQRFAETNDAANARWTAWTCVLTPDSVVDWQKPIALAERAAKSDSKAFHFVNTLGSVLYRAGRFEEAIQRLGEADRLAQDGTGKPPPSPTYTWYFLAMTHHRLGHHEEAKKWLDKAVESTEKALADHEAGKELLVWNRRLTLKLLRDEAEALFCSTHPKTQSGR